MEKHSDTKIILLVIIIIGALIGIGKLSYNYFELKQELSDDRSELQKAKETAKNKSNSNDEKVNNTTSSEKLSENSSTSGSTSSQNSQKIDVTEEQNLSSEKNEKNESSKNKYEDKVVERVGQELDTEVSDDDRIEYEIVDNDIIYNGVTYTDFNTINDMTFGTPTSKQEFIESIVKEYSQYATTDKVYFYTEEYSDEGEDVGSNIMIDDLEEVQNYEQLREQYNCNIGWKMDIYQYGMTNVMTVYGCDKYILKVGFIN